EGAEQVPGPSLLHRDGRHPRVERPALEAGVDRAGEDLRRGVVEIRLYDEEAFASVLEPAQASAQDVGGVVEVAVADPVADALGYEGGRQPRLRHGGEDGGARGRRPLARPGAAHLP